VPETKPPYHRMAEYIKARLVEIGKTEEQFELDLRRVILPHNLERILQGKTRPSWMQVEHFATALNLENKAPLLERMSRYEPDEERAWVNENRQKNLKGKVTDFFQRLRFAWFILRLK